MERSRNHQNSKQFLVLRSASKAAIEAPKEEERGDFK